jgi:hypothetical protein
MRAQAETRGTLHSTAQINVTTQEQNGQSAITIQPVNPEVWYVRASFGKSRVGVAGRKAGIEAVVGGRFECVLAVVFVRPLPVEDSF